MLRHVPESFPRLSANYAVIALCVACFATPVFAQRDSPADVFSPKGPLPTRDSEPLNTPFLLPSAEDGRVLKTGANRFDLNVDIVNNFLTLQQDKPRYYYTDFEEQRFYFGFARGFAVGQEISARLVYVDRDGGILDNFINSWHRIFGFKGGGRANFPTGQTIFDVNNAEGEPIIADNHSRSGLGDTVLEYRRALAVLSDSEISSRKMAVAGRLMVKLPTGNKDYLLGSGKADVGFGLTATARPLRRLALHGNASLVFLGKPDIPNLSPRRTLPHTLLAVEYLLDGRTSALVQTDDNPAPFRSGLYYTDRPRRAFTFGLWREIGKGRQIYLSNSENDFGVLAKCAPDFVLSFGTRWLLQ
jgi:hypothetical protein